MLKRIYPCRFDKPASTSKFPLVTRLARVFALFVILTSVIGISYTRMSAPAHVYAATSSSLNFQARLLTGSGSVVADGYYNIEFNLYSVSTGGTSEWTETRTAGNKVRVVNGYLSVGLGEVTAFPGTVNWDQDHWLTMNIGGSGVPVWDGEMTPRLKLTAVPYAFQARQAEMLNKKVGANTGVLDFLGLTANRNINLPDQSGTLCIQGSPDCVDITTSGSTGLTSSNSGLEISADGLRLMGGCADAQMLRWNATSSQWECVSGGGSSIAVRESDGSPTSTTNVLEFGPAANSDTEFVVTNEGGGVTRIRLGSAPTFNTSVTTPLLTNAGALTVATTGANDLTFTSGSGLINLNAGTVKTTSGLLFDLFNASNTTFTISNGGAGVASLNVEGGGTFGGGLVITSGGINVTGNSSFTGTISATGNVSSAGQFQGSNGSAAAPAYSFSGDTNTGIYSGGADNLRLATGGVDRLTVTADGKIGVGTNDPSAALHVPVGTTSMFGYIDSPFVSFGAYQNFLLQTEAFNAANWVKTGIGTVTANSATDPKLAATAENIPAGTLATHGLSQVITDSSTGDWTFSVYLRSQSGTVTTDLRIDSSSETGTAKTVTVTPTWQRYVVTQSFASANTTKTVRITNGTNAISAWGAQLEPSTVARPYSGARTTAALPTLTTTAQVNTALNTTGALSIAGALTGATSGAFSGLVTITGASIAATSTDRLALSNATAATAVIPVQMSPRLRLSGTVWNTTTGTSNTSNWKIENMPLSGASPSGQLVFGHDLAAGGYSNALVLNSNGNAAFAGALSTGGTTRLTGAGALQNITGLSVISGGATINGNVTIGGSSSDRLIITSQILGGNPLVFQGATDNGFSTTLNLIDPTANNSITLPNASGMVLLDSRSILTPAGSGLTGGGNLSADRSLSLDIFGLATKNTVNSNDYLAIYDDTTSSVKKISRADLLQGVLGALQYHGTWDASTNTPALSNGTGANGDMYAVSVSGSQNLGSGTIVFGSGDFLIHNGSVWQKAPSSTGVSSVFGRTGGVVAQSGDYNALQITNTPAGNLSSVTVQAALNELDAEKLGSLNGLTAISQTFANDTNVTITSSGSTHTLGWTGELSVSRGGTGAGSFTSNGILYGNGTGALQVTAAGTAGQLLIADGSGVPSFKTITGDVSIDANGVATIVGTANNSVNLGTDTIGDYIESLGILVGLSTTDNSGEGSTPGLSVLYGSTANTAVQGDTTIVCASGSDNLSGGGNTITLGSGGTCGAISTNAAVSFATSVTTPLITNAGALTVSTTGSNALTLSSGSGLINLGAATVATTGGLSFDLVDGSNTAFSINNSGAGVASLNVEGLGTFGTGLVVTSGGANITGNSSITGNLTVSGTYNTNTFTGTALTFGGASGLVSTGVTNAGLTVQSNGSGTLTLDSGTTGAINIGISATAKAITIGNGIGATNLTLNAGTGPINIGTNTIAHTTTIGNATGASSVVINCGTGACSFGASATAHATTIGSNTGAAATTIQAGTGGLVIGNAGIANTIQIGNLSGAVAQSINIGTNATAGSSTNLVFGSTVGASTTTLQAGTGGLVLNTNTLKRTASGTTTLDLIDGSNTVLALTNSGAGLANLTTDGSITAANGLTVSAGGASITGNSVITGSLTGLTGLTSSGTVTFSGLGAGLVQSSAGGVLSSGSVDRNSATFFNAALNVANGGTGAGTFTSNGLIYGNGTGALQATAAGTGGQVLLANASGVPTFTTLTGGVSVNSSGVVTINNVAANSVILGTSTTGDYVANLGTLVGLSTTGNSGEGSTPGLSVLYGSTANTAVQGNTQITCAAGTGNLSGGGTTITLGAGGTCAAINTNAAVSFATSVTSPLFTGTGAVTLSSGGSSGLTLDSASGTISLAANDTTLQRIAAGVYTFDLSDTAATTLRLTNSGTGVANLDLAEGGLLSGNVLRLSNGGALQNITGLSIISGGASIIGNTDITGILGVSSQVYVPGTSGTSAQGYFTGSSTTPLAGFQSLDLAGNTYSFFGTNKYYNGTAWVDNGLARTGSSFQMQNDSFTFYSFDSGTAFTPRFTVASGGNVGIGLSGAPSGLLSVGGTTGNFQVTSAGAVTSTSVTTGAAVVRQTGTGAALMLDRTDGVIASLKSGLAKSGFFFDNSGAFSIAADTRANILTGTGAGTDILTALANGSVGIGTSGPDSRLHVVGGGVCIEAADSGCAAASGSLIVGAGLSLLSDAATNVSGLRFGSALDANLYRSAANTLKTDGDFIAGRIGIGVAVPDRELHVNGLVRIDRNADAGGIMLHRTGLKTFFFGVNASGVNNGEFFISDFGSATSGASTRRFSINNAGQVSIGAGVANDALDVTGAVDATMGFKDNGVAGVDVAACTASQYIGDGVRINGGLVTAGTCRNDAGLVSDARLKKDITSVGSMLDNMGSVRVVTFNYKVDEMPELNLDRGLQYGVIAQELEQIFPELVSQGANGYKEINLRGLSLYNMKAVTEIAQHLKSNGDANLNNVSANTLTVNGVLEAGTIRADRIEGLEYNGRFESLEARVNQLEQRPAATPSQPAGSPAEPQVDLNNLTVGNLTVNGAATFKNSVAFEQGATITGDVAIAGSTEVEQMTVQLGLIAEGSVEVRGPATFEEVARFKKDVQFDGQVNVLGYANVQGMTVNLSLIVQGALEVKGPVTFKEMARFEKDAQFDGNVSVKGQATFNNDTAGHATVKAGETTVKVKFGKPKTAKPVISLTLGDGKFAQYSYKNVTAEEFEIVLAAPALEDLTFSWVAVSVEQPAVEPQAPNLP